MALKNIKNHTCDSVIRNGGILKTDQIELVAQTSNPSDTDLGNSRIAYNSTDKVFYGYANSLWFPLGGVMKIKTVSTTTTLTTSESGQVIKCTGAVAGTAATLTVTLPSAATAGITYYIVNDSSGDGDLSINVTGNDSSDSKQWIAGVSGSLNVLNVRGESVALVSDGGTAWLAVSRYG